MLHNFAKGRLIFGGMCSLGIGFASLNLLPNTYFIDKLQEIVQMYRGGLPVPVPEKVSKHLETVLTDMKINPEDTELIQPFTVYGFDIFNAGSMHTKFGAIVGIPSNFHYSSAEDVETENITVMNRKVDWLSSSANDFKKSLLLSEEAQKFLIAREIAYVNSPAVFLKSFYPFSTACIVYVLAHQINMKLKLLQKPLLFRGILYAIVSLFGFGFWAFLQDFTTVHFEIQADKAACALGEQYVRGGLEAYSKIIERNICLRELMGKSGARAYTVTGNDKYFMRQKHLPLSHRKSFMELQLYRPDSETKTETCEVAAVNSVQ